MSDSLPLSRKAVSRFREIWQSSDDTIRYRFEFWCAGVGMMGAAIIIQFGWTGALFCIGAIICAAAMGLED